MGFANLTDIAKLKGGTGKFTFHDIAFEGVVESIDYVPLGPGGINVRFASLQTVDGKIPVNEETASPGFSLDFTISCFMAEIDNRPRELIINQLVPSEGFGNFFSFHVRD